MAGGAETPNIAALPAIARLGTCESARGPDADRHVKLLSQFAVEGSLSGAYSQASANLPVFHSLLAVSATASLSPAMRRRSSAISGAPTKHARNRLPEMRNTCFGRCAKR